VQVSLIKKRKEKSPKKPTSSREAQKPIKFKIVQRLSYPKSEMKEKIS